MPATGAPGRTRADRLLVDRGLVESRTLARTAIEAGLVTADGLVVRRASDLLADTVALTAERPHPWVSRGGVKLAAALDAFGIDPAGLPCLDVGASTGGFTDVLLSRGAASVDAVDVGHGQLHPRLAADPRVRSHDRTDVRRVGDAVPARSVALATVDVSFISLRLVLPALRSTLVAGARLVVLVKPQFEVGPGVVDRSGIVRDAARREAAVEAVWTSMPALGFEPFGRVRSPITGGDGNVEELFGARFHG